MKQNCTNKPALIFVLILTTISSFSQIMLDPSVGLITGGSAKVSPRVTGAIHNLLFERVGFYGTIEMRKVTSEKGEVSNDFQDIAGGIIKLSDVISVYGGVGIFGPGIFTKGLKANNVRKEIGVDIHIPNTNFSVDIGFSAGTGITTNFGYNIPVSTGIRQTRGFFNPVRPVGSYRPSTSGRPRYAP